MIRTDAAARIAEECRAGGFDLVHPFPIEAFGRTDALGILIGNTRRLWPVFLEQADLSAENPLDEHTVSVISRALAPFPHQVRFAHDPIPEYVPIQRIAEASGFARLSRTRLSIHPVHGPWIALRAVAAVDLQGPPAPAPAPDLCEGCEVRCETALQAALNGKDWRAWLAVRDACNVGREWRYGEDQLVYHYTKDRSVLSRAG